MMRKVLIIGAGPAGLACGKELQKFGFSVTVYERSNRAGGLMNIIPDTRFNKKAIEKLSEGLNIEYGKNVDLDGIEKYLSSFDYVVLATGTQAKRKLSARGENLPHVYYAIDFLENIETACSRPAMTAAVIGGGNVAIDCAAEAARHGCEVTIYYRKSKEHMKADKKEIAEAVGLGVEFQFNAVIEDLGNINPAKQPDIVIIAIGQIPDIPTGFPTGRIFLCGDANIGASSIAKAVIDAKTVAKTIYHSSNLV